MIEIFEPKALPSIEREIINSQLGYKLEKKDKKELIFSLLPITTEIKKTLIERAKKIFQEGLIDLSIFHQKLRTWLRRNQEPISKDQKKIFEREIDKITGEYKKKLTSELEKKTTELTL